MIIICEMGVNWNSLEEAKAMIDKCVEFGFKFAKFQLFQNEGQGLPEHLYLTESQAKMLFEYGASLGVEVFFTTMFLEAIEWCERIGTNYYKIRHKDRHDWMIEQRILETNKPFFKSVSLLDGGNRTLGNYLYCIPKYPALLADYIRVLPLLILDGVSDHTDDCELISRINELKWSDRYIVEKHMKLDSVNRLENAWSVTFEELALAINDHPEKQELYEKELPKEEL